MSDHKIRSRYSVTVDTAEGKQAFAFEIDFLSDLVRVVSIKEGIATTHSMHDLVARGILWCYDLNGNVTVRKGRDATCEDPDSKSTTD